MKKYLATMMALVLTIAAQGQEESVDTAQFVAVYDYECRTLNEEEQNITDRMQIVVQVGRTVTKSMPLSAYTSSNETPSKEYVAAKFQEALMHMPTIWNDRSIGQTTVREFIFPNEYEGYEQTPEIMWTITTDTVSINDYLCQKATATFRGIEWYVYYTEEIPSSAGPWRLRGLPGLIIKAECEAHTFCLAQLRQEPSPITAPEPLPNVQRMKYAKLLKHKNEIYGNRQYIKNPTYYVPNINGSITDMAVFKHKGQTHLFANGGHPLLTKAHVYQPLEIK